MIKVILDTNFLVYCVKEKIDYKSQIEDLLSQGYELAVPTQVVVELNALVENARKYSDREAAKLALVLLKINGVREIKVAGKNGDQAILNSSRGNIVATHDLALKNRVKKSIVLIGKRKLGLG
jgi:rRNA-processing protein FCF1